MQLKDFIRRFTAGAIPRFTLAGAITFERAYNGPLVTVAYTSGVTIAINARSGNQQVLTITDNVATVIGAPSNPITGQLLSLTIRNASGGALGGTTFNAVFKMSTWTDPANANSQTITWRYNGTNWVQTAAGVDVPN
jgi:hypothetical protein